MPFFRKIFSGGVKDVVESIGSVADKFIHTKEEKEQARIEMMSRLMQIESELEETYKTEIQSRAEIIKAEMAQGDNFTKRARPTIVYSGLIFICIVYVIVPVLAYISGQPPEAMPQIELPSEFWWAWATVVGVYGVGRSAEKVGITNKITELATGSGANKIKELTQIKG